MKIALVGYGKMGKAIEKIIAEDGIHEICLRVQSADKEWFKDLKKADVAIEFSRPDAAVANLLHCFKAGIPVVCGTTGWMDDFDQIKKRCLQNGNSLFYAPNFSIGVNLFFLLNKQFAKIMQGRSYKAEIKEIHHTEKIDAPSGTAVQLALDLIENNADITHWESFESSGTPESGYTVPVYSERIANVPGTHLVSYTSKLDQLEIKHMANSREGFARGAVAAAEWLNGKTGVFTMADMLKV